MVVAVTPDAARYTIEARSPNGGLIDLGVTDHGPTMTGAPTHGYFEMAHRLPEQIRTLGSVSTRTTVVLSTPYENRPPDI